MLRPRSAILDLVGAELNIQNIKKKKAGQSGGLVHQEKSALGHNPRRTPPGPLRLGVRRFSRTLSGSNGGLRFGPPAPDYASDKSKSLTEGPLGLADFSGRLVESWRTLLGGLS